MISFEFTPSRRTSASSCVRSPSPSSRPATASAPRMMSSRGGHKQLGRSRVLGIGLPEEYGGSGAEDPITLGLATEALAYGDVNVAASPVQVGLGASQLARHGSRAVAERLPSGGCRR